MGRWDRKAVWLPTSMQLCVAGLSPDGVACADPLNKEPAIAVVALCNSSRRDGFAKTGWSRIGTLLFLSNQELVETKAGRSILEQGECRCRDRSRNRPRD